MILNGNQRSGARDLALHLIKDENDHVTLHQIKGFASADLMGAFREAEAISKGTRCKQFLFSLSLNPPERERVSTGTFEAAIVQVERKLGLSGQPRAIVFHEKNGRRHAHAVWSRIDAQAMKAIPLSHPHKKLREVSQALYREHGWEMPKGLIDRRARDPKNFSLDEWQQAKRIGKDARQIQSDLQDAWAISDSKAALIHALRERGYTLARGDRRGYVVLDRDCEIYALPKWLGIKTKEVRARIGSSADLPTVTEAKVQIALTMTPTMQRLEAERRAQAKAAQQAFDKERKALVTQQREERRALTQKQARRANEEAQARQRRFRSGLSGVWDRLRGETRKIKEQNQQDAWQALQRDRTQTDALVFRHLEQRRVLGRGRTLSHQRNAETKTSLQQRAEEYDRMRVLLKRQTKQRAQSRDGPGLSP